MLFEQDTTNRLNILENEIALLKIEINRLKHEIGNKQDKEIIIEVPQKKIKVVRKKSEK